MKKFDLVLKGIFLSVAMLVGVFQSCTTGNESADNRLFEIVDDRGTPPHLNDTIIVGNYIESFGGVMYFAGTHLSFTFSADSFYLKEAHFSDQIINDPTGLYGTPTHYYSGAYSVKNTTTILLQGHYDSSIVESRFFPNISKQDSTKFDVIVTRNTIYTYGDLVPGYVLDGEYPYYLNQDTLIIFNTDHRNSKLQSNTDTLLLVLKP